MENIKICVAVKSRGYGEALARALAEESRSVLITAADPCALLTGKVSPAAADADVIITDAALPENGRTLYLGSAGGVCGRPAAAEAAAGAGRRGNDLPARRPAGLRLSKLSPVKDILRAAAETYALSSGRCFLPLLEKEQKVVGVFSQEGGSGVTATALTLGRLLALKTGKASLYLNLSEADDYALYRGRGYAELPPKKELVYHLSSGKEFAADEFFGEYGHGAYCLNPEPAGNSLTAEAAGRLLSLMAERGSFAYVIVDGGRRSEAGSLCHVELALKSARDLRSFAGDGDCGQKTVRSFAPQKTQAGAGTAEAEDVFAEVREDPASFAWERNGIRISLEGVFGEDIDALAEKVLREPED